MVELCEAPHHRDGRGFEHLYPDELPLWDKMRTIAREIYGAEDIIADQRVRDQFKEYQAAGYGHFPICVAKTQYSFSTDPNLKGAPSGHVVPIRELRLAGGAEFLVVICGEIMTMPGLPKVPAAERIRLDAQGPDRGAVLGDQLRDRCCGLHRTLTMFGPQRPISRDRARDSNARYCGGASSAASAQPRLIIVAAMSSRGPNSLRPAWVQMPWTASLPWRTTSQRTKPSTRSSSTSTGEARAARRVDDARAGALVLRDVDAVEIDGLAAHAQRAVILDDGQPIEHARAGGDASRHHQGQRQRHPAPEPAPAHVQCPRYCAAKHTGFGGDMT